MKTPKGASDWLFATRSSSLYCSLPGRLICVGNMGKKKSGGKDNNKAAAKAAKKAKAAQKVERKVQKKATKTKDEFEDDDQDLESILDKIQREWEEAHKVTEELVEGPPSRRANATLTPCPNGNHLWCIGGEFFSDDGKANSFHHYRDFWCFDITTHTWERIETKVRPSARSGHRMAMWKHYIVLFGGFYDPGIKTNYLNDLWIFDTQEYKWKQIEFKETDRRPSPRSGFSFLSTPEGILLHGGYCKEYVKGSRPVGVMLDDTWFLRMTLNTEAPPSGKASGDPLTVKWEKRKKSSTAYAPSLRSGCTMALWSAKNMGILFGGVTDEDTGEETLESVFHNDLYGYQITGNGRWVSMNLKRPKKKGAQKKRAAPVQSARPVSDEDGYDDEDVSDDDEQEGDKPTKPSRPNPSPKASAPQDDEMDPDDPSLTVPLPRYNAMLAVLRNTLYIYGGIFEKGSREYTLDDFYSLQLDKLDRYVCLKASEIDITQADEESSSDEDDDDDDDGEDTADEGDREDTESVTVVGEEDEKTVEVLETIEEEKESLRVQATAFMGVAKDSTRSAEDVISTPLPGETLAMFYARSREYWAQKAFSIASDSRGKQLRRDGFTLASERYATYKPILEEVERILAEAGLDEEEMRKGAAAGPQGPSGQSRNRR
ncbi:hypothetical protein ACG7TL_008946 [Trametes sanguinea]